MPIEILEATYASRVDLLLQKLIQDHKSDDLTVRDLLRIATDLGFEEREAKLAMYTLLDQKHLQQTETASLTVIG